MSAQVAAGSTLFTDKDAAVDELEFLVVETGRAHGIYEAAGGWKVGPFPDSRRRRDALVVCKPEWMR
tara:strand:- start:145 stop:345 length:201 start_codon:yes stop_codon:yes gene_type:complete